jgi:short-subunit dehydrogenase
MSQWKNKVVVVTGGSEGLGKSIGIEFANAGATVVLLARNESKLKSVIESSRLENGSLEYRVCDVTSDESVAAAVSYIDDQFGRIDVWVNNVGQSTRIKFEECDIATYQHFIEMNLYTAVRCTMEVLPHLERTSGQVVNIGSLAAKTGWRFVAPYTVSKHGLAAFSHQFRLEGPQNVNCLFVCPGPIRRSDSQHRYEAESKELESGASRPGGGVKLKGIPPERLASRIVRCCEKRKKELVMPWYSRILFSIAQLSPSVGDFLLRKSSKS